MRVEPYGNFQAQRSRERMRANGNQPLRVGFLTDDGHPRKITNACQLKRNILRLKK